MAKQASASPSFASICSEIKSGKFHPVYFLEGEESFFIDQIAGLIENTALNEAERTENLFVFYGKDTTMADVITRARSFSMFAERQVVILREAADLKGLTERIEIRSGGKKSDINLLEEYIKNPMPSTILVICHKHKKLDGRFPVTKFFRSITGYFLSEPLKESAIPKWIEDQAKLRKLNFVPQATQLMADYLGTDLIRISAELDKILIRLGSEAEVSVEVLNDNIGFSRDFNVFELQKAFTNRDVLKAYRIVEYFSGNPKSAQLPVVLGFLYGFFNRIFLYHVTPEPRSDQAMAATMGVSPFAVREYAQAARNYPLQKIPYIMTSLREADSRFKGSDGFGLSQQEVYQELLFKIFNA